MRKNNRNLFVKFGGIVLFAWLAQGCCNKNNRNCGCCGEKVQPVYVIPEIKNGSGIIVIGNDNTVNQTDVKNTTNVLNTGSGSVNVNNNVNNNNGGTQKITQEQQTQPKPQPKKEEKKVVVNPKPVVEPEEDCEEHWHISISGKATIKTTEDNVETVKNQTSYSSTVYIGGRSH